MKHQAAALLDMAEIDYIVDLLNGRTNPMAQSIIEKFDKACDCAYNKGQNDTRIVKFAASIGNHLNSDDLNDWLDDAMVTDDELIAKIPENEQGCMIKNASYVPVAISVETHEDGDQSRYIFFEATGELSNGESDDDDE